MNRKYRKFCLDLSAFAIDPEFLAERTTQIIPVLDEIPRAGAVIGNFSESGGETLMPTAVSRDPVYQASIGQAKFDAELARDVAGRTLSIADLSLPELIYSNRYDD